MEYHALVLDRILAYAVVLHVQDHRQATTFLNAVPHAHARVETLTAVLAQCLPEYLPPKAIRHGYHGLLLPYYPPSVIALTAEWCVRHAANQGLIDVLDCIWTACAKHNVTATIFPTVVSRVLEAGHQHVLDWLDAKLVDLDPDLRGGVLAQTRRRTTAIQSGHLSSLNWLERRPECPGDFLLPVHRVEEALLAGQLDLALHLLRANQPDLESELLTSDRFTPLLTRVTHSRHRHVLEWWWSKCRRSDRTDPIDIAASVATAALSSGDMSMIEWWWQTYLSLRKDSNSNGADDNAPVPPYFGGTDAIKFAFQSGDLEPVTWLYTTCQSHPAYFVCSWPAQFKISTYPTLDCRRLTLPLAVWWSDQVTNAGIAPVVAWTLRYPAQCSRTGSLDVLQWMWDHRQSMTVHWSPRMLVEAVEHSQLAVAQWIVARHSPFPSQQAPRFMFDPSFGTDADQQRKQLAMYQWWCDRAHARATTTAAATASTADLRAMGESVMDSTSVDAVTWWLSVLDRQPPDQRKALFRTTMAETFWPVGFKLALEFADRHGIGTG
ncbi:hypothetical protein BC828DRAFT_405554 [Blastocladiella britannica]|nr:hypothetical protein BC828DRAFT_405554 [Blastocladiella britannica]